MILQLHACSEITQYTMLGKGCTQHRPIPFHLWEVKYDHAVAMHALSEPELPMYTNLRH